MDEYHLGWTIVDSSPDEELHLFQDPSGSAVEEGSFPHVVQAVAHQHQVAEPHPDAKQTSSQMAQESLGSEVGFGVDSSCSDGFHRGDDVGEPEEFGKEGGNTSSMDEICEDRGDSIVPEEADVIVPVQGELIGDKEEEVPNEDELKTEPCDSRRKAFGFVELVPRELRKILFGEDDSPKEVEELEEDESLERGQKERRFFWKFSMVATFGFVAWACLTVGPSDNVRSERPYLKGTKKARPRRTFRRHVANPRFTVYSG